VKNLRSRRKCFAYQTVLCGVEQAESAVAVGGDVEGCNSSRCHKPKVRCCNTIHYDIRNYVPLSSNVSFGNLCKFRVLTSNARKILSSVWIEVRVIAAVVWDPLWLIL